MGNNEESSQKNIILYLSPLGDDTRDVHSVLFMQTAMGKT